MPISAKRQLSGIPAAATRRALRQIVKNPDTWRPTGPSPQRHAATAAAIRIVKAIMAGAGSTLGVATRCGRVAGV
jgi:hypothetical protein